MQQFKIGRNNLACTIFVPFDCNNNCPFCTSKQMYKEMDGKMDIDKIKELITKVNTIPHIKEFVFTGGEPFANILLLDELISLCNKPCYVNTTLPFVNPLQMNHVISYINGKPNIKGVNISRHIGFDFKNIASLDDIEKILKPIRINTVINKNFQFDKFYEFVNKYASGYDRVINLRADYRNITNETLKSRDEIVNTLLRDFIHKGSSSCMVCNNDIFTTPTESIVIAYHRGLELSSFTLPNTEITFINDIIITPDGKIYLDWDFKENNDFIEWLKSNETPLECNPSIQHYHYPKIK